MDEQPHNGTGEQTPDSGSGSSDAPSGGSSEKNLIAAARAAAKRPSGPRAMGVGSSLPRADLFPGYRITKEIHRGGQGVVYQAVQTATKRKVAIKVMHDGPFAGPSERKRFEREVDILAQLSHPNIVAVIDRGEVEGSFFYVMDYISGKQLDRYLQSANLTMAQTIELCAKIADGVNAAHLRGVIHRDLKPANIKIDGSGEPHIVDFGLAKITGASTQRGGDEMMTVTGQFIGSLPWASPEQAEATPDKIDLRTDVYSLGVILYQVLTGAFPYEVVGNMRDVLDNILKAEPRRPSTVRKQINDEVETIVLKCLQKDRERRYQSAGELARDLRRYLAGEAIEAKRDSGWYVITKAMRRHRLPVAFGGAALVAVVVFGVVMFSLWTRAEAAREDAERARIAEAQSAEEAEAARELAVARGNEAVEARDLAEDRLAEVTLERERAVRVLGFLKSILAAAKPTTAVGRDVTVREVLDEALDRIDAELDTDPLVEAPVRSVMGQSYYAIGELGTAEELLRAAVRLYTGALGATASETVAAVNELALAVKNQDKHAEAETLYRRVVEAREAMGGRDDRLRLVAAANLARAIEAQSRLDEAGGLYADTAERMKRVLGLDAIETQTTLVHYGNLLVRQRKAQEAAPILRDAAASFEARHDGPHPARAGAWQRLARVEKALGNAAEAERLLRAALADLEVAYDPAHPDRVAASFELGLFLHEEKRYVDAEPFLREATERAIASSGERDARAAFYRVNLGICLMRQERLEEAEAELVAGFGVLDRAMPANHPTRVGVVNRLAELYTKMGRADEAQRYRDLLPDTGGG